MSSLSPDNSIPTSNSTAQEWILWRKSLGEYLGRKQANQYFTKFWSARAGTSARGNTAELRDYLKSVGLTIETNGIQDLQDFSGDVADTIGDIFSTGKWIAIGLGVAFVGGAFLLIYGITKNPKTIAYATPQGRALGATGKI